MADRGSASSDGAHEEHPTLEDSISASLEKQKFRLLTQVARDKKTKHELEARIAEAEERILEAKQRLGEYNALFMSIEDAASKAPKQRLGAAQAVMGTKRIIERELNKLFKDAAVTEMKLNKQKDRNGHLKGQVDQLRKEHVTFKKLFVSMTDELNAVKSRIAGECSCRRRLPTCVSLPHVSQRRAALPRRHQEGRARRVYPARPRAGGDA